VTHTGNVAGLASYNGTLTAPLPGVADGAYRVVVVADSGLQVPDFDRTNGTLAAPAALPVRAPVLTIGTPATGTITNGQDVYYRVNVPPGSSVKLRADFAAALEAEFLVSFANEPTRSSYDQSSANISDLHPQIVLPGGQGGPYYILLHGREGAGAGQTFTLQAALAGLKVDSIDQTSGVTGQQVTMILSGTGFTPQTVVNLVGPGSQPVPAKSVTFIDADVLSAVFDLTGVTAGNYTVQAVHGTQTAQAATPFQVADAAKPIELTGKVYSPALTRIGVAFPVTIDVKNVPSGAKLEFLGSPTDIQFFRLDPNNPLSSQNKSLIFWLHGQNGVFVAGDFQSGERDPGHWVFFLKFLPAPAQDGIVSTFDLTSGGSGPLDTSTTTKQADQPATVPADAWDVIWQNYTAALGSTTDDLGKVLQTDAAYFAQIGEPNLSATQLLNFEEQKANAEEPMPFLDTAVDSVFPETGLPLSFGRSFRQSIAGRYQAGGLLGRGWVSNWDYAVTPDDHGDLFIQQGGGVREFVALADDTYAGVGGDQGKLTLTADGLTLLTELDGSVTAFFPNGQLDYIQDAHGNRITAGYTGTLLTSLKHSSGDQITIGYTNISGRNLITSVKDPAGRTTTYSYDAAGEHLLSVTTPRGTTQYTYVTGQGAAREHALASVTDPTGVQRSFDYDVQGRLVRISDGVHSLTYSYLSPGGYTMTDATGATTTVLVDILGLPAKVTDADGKVTRYQYDGTGKLVAVTGPDGTGASFGYDSLGNLTRATDPLGNSNVFASDLQSGDLKSFQNAPTASTQFSYSSPATLQTITAPDGSTRQFSHDAHGLLTDTVNSRGQAITYSYDGAGRLLHKTYPDGTHTDFTYDSHGNLLTATDAGGTITMSYDGADRLTRISYPTGQTLSYQYDAAGRRTQVQDQSGFTVNYVYDSTGQLTDLTDATGARIVHYTYDAADRLQREDHGNGTYTTYGYDPNGQLLHLVNYAPGGTVNSRFDYIYNDLGRRTSMTTLDGTTTYGYDADGQLTSATLPGSRVINYQYDGAGNRIAVTDGGVTTNYTANNLDQYTAVGGSTYSYDADGNLTMKSGPGGNTTYTYDVGNRLIGVTSPTDTWSYHYDPLGNRVAVTHNGQTTRYLVDPTGLGDVLGEYDGSGNLIAHYTQGLGLTSRVDGSGAASYYDFDAVGSTAGLTGVAGGYVDRYAYMPFGEPLSISETVPNPYRYVGLFGARDGGNGLDFMGARAYDPTVGRFTQRDPINLAGGANLYRYAGNSPADAVDPSGLGPDLLVRVPTPQQAAEIGQAVQNSLKNLVDILAENGKTLSQEQVADITASLSQNWSKEILNGDQRELVDLAYSGRLALTEKPLAFADTGRIAAEDVAKVASEAASAAEVAAGEFPAFVPDEVRDGSLVDKKLTERFGQPLYKFKLPSDPRIGLVKDIISSIKVGHSDTRQAGPHDPNFLSGPGGFGPQGFVPDNASLPYTVFFENKPTAGAPAQVVTITHQLDANLDWSTFQLGDFSFGNFTVMVPPGRQDYSTRVDARSSLGVYVDVSAGLNRQTGLVTWTFTTIDPTTLDVPAGNILEGLMPPDDATGRGEGSVSFTIQPKTSDPTGTVVNAKATVTFDTGLAEQSSLDTPAVSNTIDAAPPTSSINSLPATSPVAFTVSWSGQDDPGGSGIATYDIFVSDNGGPFTLWQSATTATSAIFTGVNGHSYGFYSAATDNVGNVQPTPTAAQATTTVQTQVTPTVAARDAGGQYTGMAYPASATVTDTSGNDVSSQGTLLFTYYVGSGVSGTGSATVPSASGSYTVVAHFQSSNANYANADSAPLTFTITPAPLQITADTKSKPYGAPLPAFTVTYNGFVTGDTAASLSTPPVVTTTATAASPAGDYTLTVSGATDPNYTITFVNGMLHIIKDTTTTHLTSSVNPSVYAQPVTFTATVAPTSSSLVVTGTVTFMDGSAILATVPLSGGQASFTTTTLARGSDTITANYNGCASFQGNPSAPLTQTVQTTALEPDPFIPGATDLAVGGTAGNDVILVTAGDRPRQVHIMMAATSLPRFVYSGTFSTTAAQRLLIYGGAGNDFIVVDRRLTMPALIDGGPGNDILIAGGGPTILLGGGGNDVLLGGPAPSLLISGGGRSFLAADGPAILIGGHTDYDTNSAAQFALLAEWSRPDLGYSSRVNDLLHGGGLNGTIILDATTVHPGTVTALLLDGAGLDLYFASSKDWVVGNKKGETILRL
jgi:RHS repeat-associated protein